MIVFPFRTTTLTEELGQIEYIFSDKVNSESLCSVCGRTRGWGWGTWELAVTEKEQHFNCSMVILKFKPQKHCSFFTGFLFINSEIPLHGKQL